MNTNKTPPAAPASAGPLDLSRYDGHTPGPWENDGGLILTDAFLGPIAAVELETIRNSPPEEQARANARLIAAAPALLAELRACREVLTEALPILESLDTAREADDEPIPLLARIRSMLPR